MAVAPAAPFSIPRTLADFASRLASMSAAEKERVLSAPILVLHSPPALAADDEYDLEPINTALTRKPALGGSAITSPLVIPLLPRVIGATSQRLALGRSTICDVRLPFAEVSKVHAYAHDVTGEGCSIEDAGSTNGTEVDGRSLSPGQRKTVGNGTRIVLGGIQAEFRSARVFRDEIASKMSSPQG